MSRIRTDTPYLDEEGNWCDGCGFATMKDGVRSHLIVARVGEVYTIGDGDWQSIHPEANTCCLCKACLLKALALFDDQKDRTDG
jgi:hypothetical protein